jgi:hypothetical protein
MSDEQRTQDEKLAEDTEKSPELDVETPDVEGHVKRTGEAQKKAPGKKAPGRHF